MLNLSSKQHSSPSPTLCYLIPFDWWSTISIANSHINDPCRWNLTDPIVSSQFINQISQREKETILKVVIDRINYLQIDNLLLNPLIKLDTKWKRISLEFYQSIRNKLGSSINLPLFLLSGNGSQETGGNRSQQIMIKRPIQWVFLKLLICSSSQNHLIYGNFNILLNIKTTINSIIQFLQYSITEQSKVTFLQADDLRSYKWQTLQLQGYKGQLIMIYALERTDQLIKDQFQEVERVYQSPRINRIVQNDQEITMADQDSRTMTQHTFSTGAETPFSFGIEDQDWNLFRQYQNQGLFGQKLSQQIQDMKQYARQSIYNDIIQVPIMKRDQMINQLEKIAQQIQDHLIKRKHHCKQSKQYVKEFQFTNHSNILKQNKQHTQVKIQQNQRQASQAILKIHYRQDDFNN